MKFFGRYAFLALPVLALVACTDLSGIFKPESPTFKEEFSHDMIVLGRQLEDPYNVKNITKAIERLYPTKAAREDIMPTDKYVRFLPANDVEYEKLHSIGLVMLDHPLDYQIVRDGDYYHDPLVPEDRITWQYAVVPSDFEFPSDIRYEILHECYIPLPASKAYDLDWDLVEREAYRLTGNEALLSAATKSGSGRPSGRITVVDENANGGKPFGVSGVTVVCNSFVKFSSTTTDRDGYYQLGKSFSSDVRYRLMFRNEKGFAIGFNLLLVPASMSTLGKYGPDGIDYKITSASDRKLFSRAVVNNTVYDYYEKCVNGGLNINTPPRDLRIWLFQRLSASTTLMMRHGAVLDNSLVKQYLGDYAGILKLFLPDITLGLKGDENYSDIYATACHELAHASHYSKVGNAYWGKYLGYQVKAFIEAKTVDYGTGIGDGASQCAVSEMWAYFIQNLLYYDRYGGTLTNFGMDNWFRPQILKYLNDRGMDVSQLFQALQSNVSDVEAYRNCLISLYPNKSAIINQVFARYAVE